MAKKIKTAADAARAFGLKLAVPYINTDKLIKHTKLRIPQDEVQGFGNLLEHAIREAHERYAVESTRGEVRPKDVRPYFARIRKALLAVQLPRDFYPPNPGFKITAGEVAGFYLQWATHGSIDDWLKVIDRAEQTATGKISAARKKGWTPLPLRKGRAPSSATYTFLEFVYELYTIAEHCNFKWTAAKDGDKTSGSIIRAIEVLRDDLPRGCVPRSDRTLLNAIDKVRKAYQDPIFPPK